MSHRDVVDCRSKISYGLQRLRRFEQFGPTKLADLCRAAKKAGAVNSEATAKAAVRDDRLSEPLDNWIVGRLHFERVRESWYRDDLAVFQRVVDADDQRQQRLHYCADPPINPVSYICSLELATAQTGPSEPAPVTLDVEFAVTPGNQPPIGLRTSLLHCQLTSSGDGRMVERLGASEDWHPKDDVLVFSRGGPRRPFWSIEKSSGPLTERITTNEKPLCLWQDAQVGDRAEFRLLAYPLSFAPTRQRETSDSELSETKKRFIERIRVESIKEHLGGVGQPDDVIIVSSQTIRVLRDER